MSATIRCADGHPTRDRQPEELLLDCGCVASDAPESVLLSRGVSRGEMAGLIVRATATRPFPTHPAGCSYGGFSCGYWLIAEGCELGHWERHIIVANESCPCGTRYPGAAGVILFDRSSPAKYAAAG